VDFIQDDNGGRRRKGRLLNMVIAKLNFFVIIIIYINVAFISFARNFDEIFPGINTVIKDTAFSGGGYYNYLSLQADKTYSFTISPSENSGIGIAENFRLRKPEYIIESLIVLPFPDNKKTTVLDIYNTVINVKKLSGRKYFSFTRKKEVPLFESATRINNLKEKKPVNDPAASTEIPERENVYSRVKDINFGYCYYLSELYLNPQSISYMLSNVEDISLLFFTVIKKGNVDIQFYIEPIDEGIVIYALSAIIMERIAARAVDIPSATKKRFDVVKGWIEDGINGKF
jgi:hypothetical protein